MLGDCGEGDGYEGVHAESGGEMGNLIPAAGSRAVVHVRALVSHVRLSMSVHWCLMRVCPCQCIGISCVFVHVSALLSHVRLSVSHAWMGLMRGVC